MKIIVGLGNPGPRYRNTRHNIGFMVLDALAERVGAALDKEKHRALQAKAVHQGVSLLLVKPMTFMNLSGEAVAPAARNKVESLDDLLVVCDDVNLPLGKLRLRAEGSAGGHNGLKSIIEHLGTQAFSRLRIGVGANETGRDLSEHVLGTFTPDEAPAVQSVVSLGVDAALRFITEGIGAAMNEFNAFRAP